MSEHNSKDVELSDNRARYMKDHEYTWEIIYHFNCGECMNWWSYASTQELPKLEKITRLNLLEAFTWLSYETDLNTQNKVKTYGNSK